ncbi:eCIS core domain-containing protein [Rhodovulum marinum]|uniref:Uncharacterized protein DUF4157 n=1 Tax=Rhodovulum marinum TaxID=320662 RepID=A0A4R2Q0V9_9RHOB|nr:DUF4157 domain-containing protein [Rhodovulum marinum]TCP40171.1 uncharacterized protein DUF4157 [Rhodovulum marinum]
MPGSHNWRLRRIARIFASERPTGRRPKPAAPGRAAPGGTLDALRDAAGASRATRDLVQLQAMADALQRTPEEDEELLQGKASGASGLPTRLRAGVERLSGRDMRGVNVHYNSPRPAAVQAHAFARAADIHLPPGQERHLPHEAWHIVQQAEGRVAPTAEIAGQPVNDDAGLEREADAMGARAPQEGSRRG